MSSKPHFEVRWSLVTFAFVRLLYLLETATVTEVFSSSVFYHILQVMSVTTLTRVVDRSHILLRRLKTFRIWQQY